MNENNSKLETARLYFEVGKILKHRMHKTLGNGNLTLPQSIVIGTLIKSGKIKISELSAKVNLSNSTVSGILDRLEKQGLIARTRSEEDRRTVYVQLTDKFEEIHRGAYKKAEESFEDLLKEATREQIEKINEGLTILKVLLKDRLE